MSPGVTEAGERVKLDSNPSVNPASLVHTYETEGLSPSGSVTEAVHTTVVEVLTPEEGLAETLATVGAVLMMTIMMVVLLEPP